MTNGTEIWSRNILSGALLKLAQTYYKQGQLPETLALLLKATYTDYPNLSGYHFHLLLFFTIPLWEVLGEEQYSQILRAALNPVTKETLLSHLEAMHQSQQDPAGLTTVLNILHLLEHPEPELTSIWKSTVQSDAWNDASFVSLPEPDPEFQQLCQAFLDSVRHKLSSAVSKPLSSAIDAYYAQTFAHLNLPLGFNYPIPNSQSFSKGQEIKHEEEAQALRARNHYAFFRYIKTLRNHTEAVYTVVFSPDGGIIASGSADTTIKLWDSKTRQELRTLTGHSNSVLCVAISPDGQTLASGSTDLKLKLWDVQTGQERQTLTGHSNSVLCVAISPDGQTLASGSVDGMVKLWHIQTGQEIGTLAGHSNSVLCLAISPDGQTLASGGADATIKLWDLPTQQERLTLTQNSDCVYSLCFHPQGQTLVSSHRNDSLKIWELNTCELIRTIPLLAATEVVSVAISSDGQAIAGGGGSKFDVIWIWNFNTGKGISSFCGLPDSFYLHRDLVYAVAFSLDNSLLASASRDGTIKLWGIPEPLSF